MVTRSIRSLAVITLASLVLMSPGVADAKTQKRPPTDAESALSTICGAFGGTTSTDTMPIVVDGGSSKGPKVVSRTECDGGLLGGMYCVNYETFTTCVAAMPSPPPDNGNENTSPFADADLEQVDTAIPIDAVSESSTVESTPVETSTQPVGEAESDATPTAEEAEPPVEDTSGEPTLPVEEVVDGNLPSIEPAPLDDLVPLEPVEITVE